MKADLSRSTFSPAKHYRDVRWQMGRVPVDADLNEYVDLAAHRVETETVDVVGHCGGPTHDAAFQLAASPAGLPLSQQAAATALGTLAPGDFLISAGRYYVQGLLCENETPIKFSGQSASDLPGAVPVQTSGLYLAYLDVWARHLTFIDDPGIREVALGGPDTATRNKTVWQLKLVRVGDSGTAPDCNGPYSAYDQATAASTGTLAADVDPTPVSAKPCVLPPGGGYRRIENQLYRVEIHDPGSANGAATFKWSRDNGAVVSAWEPTGEADTVRLKQPPRDDVLGFASGQWVELTDDHNDLLGQPGFLVEVAKLDGDLLKLKAAVPAGQFTLNPKVRRWDSVGAVPVTSGAPIPLEDGVRAQFTAGTYNTGDYWMIPARTATANVEWPQQGGAAMFLPPQGIVHRYCRVGFVDFNGTAVTVHDCRDLFPPLTEVDVGCDLKLHNRHLHGSGVVCGLQVNCGGADRQSVVIQAGHAIDCAGTDLLLEAPQTFPVLAQAQELKLLDGQNTGDVLLTLTADDNAQPVFGLRAPPADAAKSLLLQILEGTIWQDFYHDCFQPLADYLQKAFVTVDANDTSLVPLPRRRMITALNLLAHRSGAASGRRLWLSQDEHNLLAAVYADLQKFASGSPTFCAIADTFAPFPEYPFAEHGIRTMFAARTLSGVKALPDGRFAYSWSDALPGRLFQFDLTSGEMVADVALTGADGLAVQDVTFATFNGTAAVVVAAANAAQTVFCFVDPATLSQVASPVVLQGGSLTTLATHPQQGNVVLAVQPGAGVHFLTTERMASGQLPTPGWGFNAAGHLSVGDNMVCATVANAAGPPASGTYSALRFGTLRGGDGDNLGDQDFPLSQFNSTVATGSDGLVFGGSGTTLRLHVVVDPPVNRTTKGVLVLDPLGPKPVALLDLPPADNGTTTGRVFPAAMAAANLVVFALSDRNQLLWTSATATSLPAVQTLPAQLAPVAVTAVMGKAPSLVVANQASQTLTLIPVTVSSITFVPPPVGPIPVGPIPVGPAPVQPAPVIPVGPAPVHPTPVDPVPVQPPIAPVVPVTPVVPVVPIAPVSPVVTVPPVSPVTPPIHAPPIVFTPHATTAGAGGPAANVPVAPFPVTNVPVTTAPVFNFPVTDFPILRAPVGAAAGSATVPTVTDQQIGTYRDALLQAYQNLLITLLQELKDCLCEHLLLDCPECGEDKSLPLATITIQGGQVHHICNFGRREVLTFPKVKYWLSAVPIIPLVSHLVSRFCCWVVQPPAATTPGTGLAAFGLQPGVLVNAVNLMNTGALRTSLADGFLRTKLLGSHWFQTQVQTSVAQSTLSPAQSVRITDLVGTDAQSATAALAGKGVEVASVSAYDPSAQVGAAVFDASNLPPVVQAGQKVQLFTQGGKVVFFRRVPPATAAVTSEQFQASLDTVRSQLGQLQASNAQFQQSVAATASELRLRLQQMSSTATAPAPAAGVSPADLKAGLEGLQAQIAALNQQHAAELSNRDRQIADLIAANTKLRQDLTATSADFKTRLDQISRIRPTPPPAG